MAEITGARVVSVFGANRDHVLVVMPVDAAQELLGVEDLADAPNAEAISAVERFRDELRRTDPALADSVYMATALEMARQLQHPYNSATSKAATAQRLHELTDRLRELAPPEEKRDGLDDLARARRLRLAGGGTAA